MSCGMGKTLLIFVRFEWADSGSMDVPGFSIREQRETSQERVSSLGAGEFYKHTKKKEEKKKLHFDSEKVRKRIFVEKFYRRDCE